MSTTYQNALSQTGTCVMTQAANPYVTWNLTSLEVSFAGPSNGPNARVTIYDGTVAAGTVLYRAFLTQPVGSIGCVQKINLPVTASGQIGLQALPGNAMNIVVDGFGANQCSINARFNDGLT